MGTNHPGPSGHPSTGGELLAHKGGCPMHQQKTDMLSVKNANRALILQCLRRRHISRIDISKETNLSKAAVTILTNDMVKEGLLKENGVDETLAVTVGRRPILLGIVPDYRFAVGVGLHRKRIAVNLVNLELQQLDLAETCLASFRYPDQAVEWICSHIKSLVAKHELDWDKCVGIGVSSPGPLDYKNGIILNPPNFEMFANYPITERLTAQLGKPVSLENNSVVLAITDYLCNSLEPFSQVMFITAMEGIGTAILSRGKVMRGFAGFAGELGHSSVDINGIPCSCGNKGCLEQYVTLAALRQRFNFESYVKLVDDAYSGYGYALNIIAFVAEYLGCAIASASNILDLDAVVLHGDFNYRPEMLLDRIKKIVSDRSVICRTHPIAFHASCLGPESVDVANAVGVINSFFSQQY